VSGLLIVNADDFGGNPLATERIAECFAANRITSTTAMVYMQDSPRAAEIAASRSLAVGLHLNLTQEFENPATPGPVRERQARAVRYFAGRRSTRFIINPVLVRAVGRCIEDQLDRFRELFGREPTHIDGHNHVHLSPTVLLALPKGARVRTAESSYVNSHRATAHIRRARHLLIAGRQLTTDRLYAINRLKENATEQEMRDLLAPAERLTVEIMVHPDRNGDYRLLMSDEWRDAIGRHRLGCFDDLTPSHARLNPV
jgi:predicted glycoside hydrolase/deacetylase ChbG (UPF0249 family)